MLSGTRRPCIFFSQLCNQSFLPRALLPLSGKWHLETKIWGLGVLGAKNECVGMHAYVDRHVIHKVCTHKIYSHYYLSILKCI